MRRIRERGAVEDEGWLCVEDLSGAPRSRKWEGAPQGWKGTAAVAREDGRSVRGRQADR